MNFPSTTPAQLLSEKLEGMIAPHIGDVSLLTQSRTKGLSSRADLAPQALRPGCEQADSCPSRIGNELHYPNGTKVTL